MRNLTHYFSERFPLAPLVSFCALTLLAIAAAFPESPDQGRVVLMAVIYLGFLFHLRVLDEYKDFQYDVRYYPHRPVARGDVKLNTLKKLDGVNLSLVSLIALYLAPPTAVILFFGVLLYSGLMFKDFFIERFYERSPVFYLASHQFVFVPFYLFFYSVLTRSFWLPGDLSQLAGLVYLLAPVALIEIGRKIKHRLDSSGRPTSDTYAYRWGQKVSIRVFATLVILAGVVSLLIDDFRPRLSYLLIFSGVVVWVGAGRFKDSLVRYSLAMTLVAALALPTLLLL